MAETQAPPSVAMDGQAIERSLRRMAHEIIERNHGARNLALVGIVTRGDVLAGRLAALIEEIEGATVPLGRLDISFYRDDFATYLAPEVLSTDILFDIDGRDVVLVDDVLYTGRTIRAALDALGDIGRPETVQLAVLVDRGHRQLPICPDYTGETIASTADQSVRLLLEEVDGVTQVQVTAIEAGTRPGSAPLGRR